MEQSETNKGRVYVYIIVKDFKTGIFLNPNWVCKLFETLYFLKVQANRTHRVLIISLYWHVMYQVSTKHLRANKCSTVNVTFSFNCNENLHLELQIPLRPGLYKTNSWFCTLSANLESKWPSNQNRIETNGQNMQTMNNSSYNWSKTPFYVHQTY